METSRNIKIGPALGKGFNTSHARGISLYTLLAAVVVLGVLTSVLVTSFTGTHTKGQALWAMMHNIGQAANQFHLDTSCYPIDFMALWDSSSVQTGDHKYRNSCNTSIPTAMWHGPYLKKIDVGGVNNDRHPITEFGPTSEMTLRNTDATDNDYSVRALNVPSDILEKAYEACGGEGSLCRISSDQLIYYYTGNTNE